MSISAQGEQSWRSVWAKAPAPKLGERRLWLPLHAHLTDTGTVIDLIWDEWVGDRVRQVVVDDLGGDDAAARAVVVMAGALHDAGKCTRSFAGQVPEMRTQMEERGFTWERDAVEGDARRLPHSLAGHVIVRGHLVACGVPASHADLFASVVGGHHGVPPTRQEVEDAAVARRWLGAGEWQEARDGLLGYVQETLRLDAAVEALRRFRLSDASQVLLTGLVVMADWIASNPEMFPLVPAWRDVAEDPRSRGRRGWEVLGLPSPWEPTEQPLSADPTLLLRSRFDVEHVANEVQRAAVAAAREMPEPGLLLIEAVMGVGKTEAALLAAEVLAARFGCAGVFYGLPTRATTDAMFARFLTWWGNVPGQRTGARNVGLRHGLASLNDTYRALPRRGSAHVLDSGESPLGHGDLVDVGRDVADAPAWRGRRVPAQLVAHHWTAGRKSAAFADSVIATIDHELLLALQSRHVVMRHLGLARQVVILDEVHSADTWMQVYLERSLEWLGRYRVPVVALSATLAPDLRTALVASYERGRRAGVAARQAAGQTAATGRRAARLRDPLPQVPTTDDYPVLTVLSGGQVQQLAPAAGDGRQVSLEWLADGDLPALWHVVRPVLEQGGCVLVVCNTVRRAVDRYQSLRSLWGDRVSLAHSRFIARDRLANDAWLRATFGRGDVDRAGRVVVATQVAEQSLDLDFDLLVTDLAPIDLVLQRIGRLHRHPERVRPPSAALARCVVTGVSPTPSALMAPTVDRGAVTVYGAHHLLRSAALLDEWVSAGRPLQLPAEVPIVVRRCYGDDPVGPEAWQPAMLAARDDFLDGMVAIRSAAETYQLRAPGESRSTVGMLSLNAGEADSDTGIARQVRNTDGGVDVILLVQADDGLRLLPQFGDDRAIPTDTRPDRDTAALLARSMVRLPGWVTSNPGWTNLVLDDLTSTYYREWQKDPLLGGQLVLLLTSEGTGSVGPFPVRYDTETGLEVTRV